MNPTHAIGAASGPAAIAPRGEHARLREAAEAFESILIQQMFRRMREAQLEGGFFGEGTGASTYEAMFEEGLASRLAAGSPFGVADMLEAQWLERAARRSEIQNALDAATAARTGSVHERALEAGGAGPGPGTGAVPAVPGTARPANPQVLRSDADKDQ
jgi:flagellar protein FlgJ